MAVRYLTFLSVALFAVLSGCNSTTSEAYSHEVDIVVPEPPANMEDVEVVLYEEAGEVVGADMWLPENDEGVTLIELSSNGSAGFDRMALYAGDERVLTMRVTDDGLVGTITEMPDGSFARLDEVEDSAWIWTVQNADGERTRVKTNLPAEEVAAQLQRTPIQTAAYQVPEVRAGYRPLKFAVTSAVAPLNFVTSEGSEIMDRELGLLDGGCSTSSPEVECDVSISPVTGDIHVSNWVRTDLSSLPEGTMVYQTVQDCSDAQDDIGRFEIQIGFLGLAASAALGELPVAIAGVSVAAANVLGVAGYLTEMGISSSAPKCTKYDLTSNETIRDVALKPFVSVQVDASWQWKLSPDLVDEGWTVASMTPPGTTGIQPFLDPGITKLDLPAVTVTVARNEPSEPAPGSSGGTDLVGTVFSTGFDDRILAREPRTYSTITETRVQVTERSLGPDEPESGIVVTVGPDRLATIEFRINSVYEVYVDGLSEPYRRGCKRGTAVAENVQIGENGRFIAVLPNVQSGGFREIHVNDGDPCANMSTSSERREGQGTDGDATPEFSISGQLDAESGSGVVHLDMYEQLTGEDYSYTLTRE